MAPEREGIWDEQEGRKKGRVQKRKKGIYFRPAFVYEKG
jgi:hypothetical protein